MAGAPAARVSVPVDAPTVALLDQYLRGEFDDVTDELARIDDFDEVLEALRRDGSAWTEAGGPADVERRRLAAATFALEAGRAAARVADWKWVQNVRGQNSPPDAIWWKAPPLIIEWGCEILRRSAAPTAAERLWHLATAAAVQRIGDHEFLIGSPSERRGNPEDEIEHLGHAIARFPDEPRFALAQAIGLERNTWTFRDGRTQTSSRFLPAAANAFRQVLASEAIAGEAMARLGAVLVRQRRPDEALEWFEKAERASRDPFVVYLARYFRGQAFDRKGDLARAEEAYRAALAAIPRAQSATMALATVLARTNRPLEAGQFVEASLTEPIPADPWREYSAADARFWPLLIGRLRQEIVKGLPAPGPAERGPASSGPAEAGPDVGADDRAQAGQRFRTTADAVVIDVSVRTNGIPVAGLEADDFVLTDNGVRQDIDALALEAVPIDVTIVIDTGKDMVHQIDGLTRQARLIAGLARPTDRVRVMAAGTYVRDLVPAAPVAERAPMPERLTTAGPTAAYDALAAALLRPVPSDRRHLVLAMMNGIDAISAIDITALRDIARASGATLNVSQVDMTIESSPILDILVVRSGRQRVDEDRCQTTLICEPSRMDWVPYDERMFDELDEAARMTGGQVYFPSIFTVASASNIFERAFEDYRRSYLLRYVPKGVTREGWHDVEVSLPNHPGYTVRARRGYAVDASARAGVGNESAAGGPTTVNPLAGGVPMTIESLIAAYDRGDYGAVSAGLHAHAQTERLIADYREAGNPWPANPRREAAFVLELGAAGLHGRTGRARVAARGLLVEHERLVRHPIEPDPFQRYWSWAVLAVVENIAAPSFGVPFVESALERFPDEPRLVLARAVLLDQRRPDGLDAAARGERMTDETTRYVEGVLAAYDDAMRFEATVAEGALRKAWLLHRVGRVDEALDLLDRMTGADTDTTLAYLRDLFRGRALEALGRAGAATEAYRAALAVVPAAQSARVGLMTSLLVAGDRDGAAAAAEAIQASAGDTFDPWWAYWSGDYRFYGEIIQRLREQTR
jgi:VWFA-related protein